MQRIFDEEEQSDDSASPLRDKGRNSHLNVIALAWSELSLLSLFVSVLWVEHGNVRKNSTALSHLMQRDLKSGHRISHSSPPVWHDGYSR